MRKPKPGVCGVCGTAVVQPATDDTTEALACGHIYELYAGKRVLKKVRCLRHQEERDGFGSALVMPELVLTTRPNSVG